MTDPWEEDWGEGVTEEAGPWDDFATAEEPKTKSEGIWSRIKDAALYTAKTFAGAGETVLGTAGAIAAPVAGGLVGGTDLIYQGAKDLVGGEPD